MERIGIYGGTFNPPHVGHIRAAEQALHALKLDRLLLIPDRIAPHKTLPEGSPTPEQRLQMLRLSVEDQHLEVSDLELRRSGVSYTWLTVEELRSAYPDAQLYLLMGTDMFLSFLSWREPERILKNTTLAVLCRGDRDEKNAIAAQKRVIGQMGYAVELVDNPVTSISSTQLRRLLAFGCGEEFLPRGAAAYIREHGLYNTAACWKELPMEKLEQVVVSLLKPGRVAHVLGCRDMAVELAMRWGADPVDAARAGLLHDVTKALDGPLQLTLCEAYGKVLSDFSKKYPKTLHALTGALVAERIFGENENVVSAICHHTTGRADMTLLEKIVYVADYVEPNRTIPGVEKLRKLAFEDLDAALKLGLEMTLEHLSRQGSEVSPESREALAWLNR